MILSDFSLKRPIAMTVLIIALCMFGAIALFKAGVDLVPTVDIPYISVMVVYPGASPEEIETSVAKKVEEAVSQVDGLKHVTATSADNFCQVMLEFNLDRDVDIVAQDVREKIDLIRNDLPSGAESPKVMKYDINAKAVVTIAILGADPDDMYDFADRKLKDRFSSLSGVADIDLIGGEEREVVVNVEDRKLAAYGYTMAEVVQSVGKGNVKVPTGQVSENLREFNVMFDAEAKTPEALGEIELTRPGGPRLYLRDIATFGWGTKRRESIASLDGHPAVVMKVRKKGEANAAAVVNLVRRTFDEVSDVPDGMELRWVRDDGDYINATVRGGIDSIWQGVLLTGLVLILFLGDFRTAFVAFISIPLTILISLIAFPVFGYTYNVITMSAMGISVGILVANSIVVLENIAARRAEGGEVKGVVARAVDQVAIAVFASAMTNIVVFLPITTMKTLSGKFFVPFAVVVTVSTFASLFVSFTLTPMLSWLLSRSDRGRGRAFAARVFAPWNWCYEQVARGYSRSLAVTLRWPKTFMLVALILTLVGFRYATNGLQMDFSPTMDQGEMTVRLEFPSDMDLDATNRRAKEIAEVIKSVRDSEGEPVSRRLLLTVGKTEGMLGKVSKGSYLAEFTIGLEDMSQRRDSVLDLMIAMRKAVNEIPDVTWAVMVPSIVGGSSQTAEMRVLGDDLAVLGKVASQAANQFRAEPSAADVTHSVRAGRPELSYKPNRAVLADLGVSPDVLGVTLRAAMTGLTPATFTKGDRSYDVRVRLGGERAAGRKRLEATNFPLPNGKLVPLSSLAKASETLKPVQIVRCDRERAEIVYSNNAKGYGLGTTLSREQEILKPLLPRGYHFKIGGTAEYMEESFKEFGGVTLIAVVLAFLLLCAIMESWVRPFVILFTIPFSYLGMFLAIKWTGSTLSVFGLLAGIMLVGVVVNAAILLIDEIGQREDHDVLKASEAKFRPIVMSCSAALFGMLPMAICGGLGSELRQAMGIGSVGGIILSSLVSIYLIPVMMSFGKRKQ